MSDKVKHISEETLDLLTQAAASAEDAIASGVDPKTAFMQAAKDFDLTPQQTKLLIRGWNITNFTEKFGSSRKLEDRCAEVPVLHFDEFEKLMNAPVKTASVNNGPVWYGYDIPPEVRIKRVYQKDPLKGYESVLATDEFFFKVADAEKFVKRNFNKLIDLRRQAYDAFTSLVSDFQIKLGELKSAIKVSGIPKDVLVGNLNVVNPLAARIVSDVLKEVKCASLVRDRVDYSFDEKQEPYKTALKCAALMVSIDDKKKLLNKLDKIWAGYKFEDKVIKKQAEWSVESMEISPLVGGVYSKRRWGYFNDNVLDVEDPDFFVVSGGRSDDSFRTLKTASDNEGPDSSPPKFTEEDVLERSFFTNANAGLFDSVIPKVYFAESQGNDPDLDKSEKEKFEQSIKEIEEKQEREKKRQEREEELNKRRQEREEELHQKKLEEINQRLEASKKKEEQESRNQEKAKREAERKARISRMNEIKSYYRNVISNSANLGKNIGPIVGGIYSNNFYDSEFRTPIFGELEDSINKIQAVERYNEVAKSVHFIKSLGYAVEFIAQDPVIRDYSLEDVVGAVYTLRAISPLLADNVNLLRSITRKYLEQGGMMDLNDIATLIKLNSPKSE